MTTTRATPVESSCWIPAAVALAALAAIAGVLALRARVACGGAWVYPLDDAYIHLAMARTLAEHGAWGVTPASGFSHASSSPLWTLALAGARRLGFTSQAVPLVLNFAAATAALLIAAAWLGRRRAGLGTRLGPVGQTAALLALVMIVPLPATALLGMEHSLQIALTLALAWTVQAGLAKEAGGARSGRSAVEVTAIVAAALLTATRYEGLFLVAVAGALWMARGRRAAGLALWAAGWAPIVAMGLFARAHGGGWLPNSLWMKGNVPEGGLRWVASLVAHPLQQMVVGPEWPWLLAAALAAMAMRSADAVGAGLEGGQGLGEEQDRLRARARARARNYGLGTDHSPLVLLLLGTAVVHLALAQVGRPYRYDASLIALAWMAALEQFDGPVRGAIRARWRAAAPLARAAWIGAMALALVPLVPRAFVWPARLPRACKNIHDQQWQMGRFLREHYPGRAVAVNDIGAVAWLAEPPLLDLAGLGTQAVAQARGRGGAAFGPDAIDTLTRAAGVPIAMVYDEWFDAGRALPPEWVRVARWTIPDNYIAAYPTVAIYATSAAAAPELARRLAAFASSLPADVRVEQLVR